MNRFKLWNKWQKRSLNGPLYKLLVLLGLVHSPTFEMQCLLADIVPYIIKGFEDGIKGD